MNILKMNPHETKLVAFAGANVSNSTAIHLYNHLCDLYDLNAVFFPMNIAPDKLEAFFEACGMLHFTGTVLCAPHKSPALNYVQETDNISRTFRSINCVSFGEDGVVRGHGFDGKGVIYAFQQRGASLKNKRVLMAGAGGVGGVFAAEMAECGADKIVILNRTPEKAASIAKEIQKMYGIDVAYGELTAENLNREAEMADVFLQATSLGRKGWPEFEDYTFVERLPQTSWVLDAVSNPPETALIKKAKQRGLNVVLGMEMQVCQIQSLFKFLFDFDMDDKGRKAAIEFFCEMFGYTYQL